MFYFTLFIEHVLQSYKKATLYENHNYTNKWGTLGERLSKLTKVTVKIIKTIKNNKQLNRDNWIQQDMLSFYFFKKTRLCLLKHRRVKNSLVTYWQHY